MSIEIERKFLVKNNSFKALSSDSSYLKQGYICLDKERTVRVRIKGSKGYLTIKGMSNDSGLSRFEWEKEISLEEANQLFKLVLPGVIEKTRYNVPIEGYIWEIDVFEGGNSGLILAEIELETELSSFVIPSFIGEEVTGDKRYYNAYLSQSPYDSW
ncbi:adenylate cyclase [Bacteroides coprosuis DSM 18011]|uniref:Adenylate cyclase n=1 Tax=Bacteroides coprosuis DSM 18011 TaxID=679937 RepID=F3ZRL5_9BACE|nr:CYTH domain-containing protein [Bacteroides coprosuis]EGJ70740.1 adenylate cyclase [Bacteroides coprosuis DSM 18011]